MPDTAVAGTAHEAVWVQLPQSYRPVLASVRQAGWVDAVVTLTVATLRAPAPP